MESDEGRKICPNPECGLNLAQWVIACPRCGWLECHACGKWFKPEHQQHLCPSCDAPKRKS
jgi:Zn finger protein HypA/HybF involved in hydrogenase expression